MCTLAQPENSLLGEASAELSALFYPGNSLSQERADDLRLMSKMFDPDILEDSRVIKAVHSLRVSPQLLSSAKLA